MCDINHTTNEIDSDGDGYVECVYDSSIWQGSPNVIGGEDCDDNNAQFYETLVFYADTDGDGYGDPTGPLSTCGLTPGYVSDSSDCNDADNTVYPNASELCDGQLNDCSGVTVPSIELDNDNDGYVECPIDAGGWDGQNGVAGGEDCDDTNPNFYSLSVWYYDNDLDGFGNSNASMTACVQPQGYVAFEIL